MNNGSGLQSTWFGTRAVVLIVIVAVVCLVASAVSCAMTFFKAAKSLTPALETTLEKRLASLATTPPKLSAAPKATGAPTRDQQDAPVRKKNRPQPSAEPGEDDDEEPAEPGEDDDEPPTDLDELPDIDEGDGGFGDGGFGDGGSGLIDEEQPTEGDTPADQVVTTDWATGAPLSEDSLTGGASASAPSASAPDQAAGRYDTATYRLGVFFTRDSPTLVALTTASGQRVQYREDASSRVLVSRSVAQDLSATRNEVWALLPDTSSATQTVYIRSGEHTGKYLAPTAACTVHAQDQPHAWTLEQTMAQTSFSTLCRGRVLYLTPGEGAQNGTAVLAPEPFGWDVRAVIGPKRQK